MQPVPFTWAEDGRSLLVVTGSDPSNTRISEFRATDGRFIGSITGVGGLQQLVALD
jgi:hypothetical protein